MGWSIVLPTRSRFWMVGCRDRRKQINGILCKSNKTSGKCTNVSRYALGCYVVFGVYVTIQRFFHKFDYWNFTACHRSRSRDNPREIHHSSNQRREYRCLPPRTTWSGIMLFAFKGLWHCYLQRIILICTQCRTWLGTLFVFSEIRLVVATNFWELRSSRLFSTFSHFMMTSVSSVPKTWWASALSYPFDWTWWNIPGKFNRHLSLRTFGGGEVGDGTNSDMRRLQQINAGGFSLWRRSKVPNFLDIVIEFDRFSTRFWPDWFLHIFHL